MEAKDIEKEFLSMIANQKRIIYKICYMFANNHDDMNDLSQEVVLNLWKSFPIYKAKGKPSTWVYRIAMNTCITFLRRTKVRPKYITLTSNINNMTEENDVRSEQIKELYTLINQLGKLERALILLWLEDLNYQEIADILGISKNNVAIKLHRTKEKLKKMSNC